LYGAVTQTRHKPGISLGSIPTKNYLLKVFMLSIKEIKSTNLANA
jgi:hypothetical protein